MVMRKPIASVLLAIALILPIPTKADSAATPIEDSTQLRLQDMLVLFLIPNIADVLGNYYYPHILKFTPDIEPWHIEVVHTERMNGFRGFILSITLDVEPTAAHHVPVGKDRMTYQISVGPLVRLVNHTHLSTYDLSSE